MARQAAFVTLLTKTAYLPGTLVLHLSLKNVGAKYPLVVMVTPTVTERDREILRKRGIKLRDIESLAPEAGKHSLSTHDARFTDTWTKLRAFELEEYEVRLYARSVHRCSLTAMFTAQRIVLLDSDMIVMRNMDELMDLPLPADWIAAAHACACNPRKLAHYPPDW